MPLEGSTYSQQLTENCLARLEAKTKVREMLLADEVALATHTDEGLRKVMDRFSHACRQFKLIISIKKTNVVGQDVTAPPSVNIDNVTLDVVDQFIYLSSTITSNLSLDAEINVRCSCHVQAEQESVEQNKFNRNIPNYLFTRRVLSTLL